MQQIFEAFATDPDLPPGGPAITWIDAESLTRKLPPRTNLVIPKTRLAGPAPFVRSRRGRLRGALQQFRCHAAHENLHIKEFESHWVIHVDEWNPHHHLWLHLAVDRGYRRFFHIGGLLDFHPRPAFS